MGLQMCLPLAHDVYRGARDRKRTPMGFYVVFQWIIGFQPDEPNLETGVNVLMLYGIATRKH
jgi:hypothetical protein